MTLSPLGDAAVVIELGSERDEVALTRVHALTAALRRDPPAGVIDIVPAFATVTVFYDLLRIGGFESFCAELKTRAGRAAVSPPHDSGRLVEIPVCYGDEWGPDLLEVATSAGQSPDEVVALHSGADYRVFAIGFAPGFPYLIGLPAKLQIPRRANPRVRVPAGSVAIGGAQTGIYPLAMPGGWNLIGQTPLALFQAEASPAALLNVGDRVKFRPITKEAFARWK